VAEEPPVTAEPSPATAELTASAAEPSGAADDAPSGAAAVAAATAAAATAAAAAQGFGAYWLSGIEPGEYREHGSQLRLTRRQGVLHLAEHPLLARGQAHILVPHIHAH
jgi:hypothetical protein